MLGQDPPESYDDDEPLTARNVKHLEYTLKYEIAEGMVRSQYNRAKGDNPNGYAKRKVIDNARMLRKILKENGSRERKHSVIDFEVFDKVSSRIEYDGQQSVHDIVRELHRTGSKPEVRL